MLNASKEKLDSFFQNNYQYRVPFFQRSYVWDNENWEIFWNHMMVELEEYKAQRNSEHFIGTIITKQTITTNFNENIRELVDGQQRLTTTSLFLKAIADTAKGDIPMLKDNVDRLLKFKDSWGKDYIRIIHSRNDKKYFEAVIKGEDTTTLEDQENKILLGYKFYMDKLKDFSDVDREHLRLILLNKVPVIAMLLGQDDDEQEIFDTINSLGTRLTTAELLKNFIFKDNEVDLFKEYWEKTFEADTDQIKFWGSTKTSGRVKRSNLELLLYCYLIVQNKNNTEPVKLDKLFNEYKLYLKDKDAAAKEELLKELREYASIYFNFPDGTELNQFYFSEDEKRFFHVIENLEISTVYPLVLYIYRKISDPKIRIELLKVLESYLVRRNICRLTSKNYNNLFVQIIVKCDALTTLTTKGFSGILEAFTEDTNRFPDNNAVIDAAKNEGISNANANEILFCIALYQVNNGYSDIQALSSHSYSVEHMMPQSWKTNWSVKGMSEIDAFNRSRKIKTLGNLTLVTQKLNSSMKNAAWISKQKSLKTNSMLKITTDYLAKADWNESEIESRANDLSNLALQIWKK